jgi:hypothetical protein
MRASKHGACDVCRTRVDEDDRVTTPVIDSMDDYVGTTDTLGCRKQSAMLK